MERSRFAPLPAPVSDRRWSSPAVSDEPLVRVSLTRYFAALRRYKWLMALVALLGAAAGVFLARRLSPVYEVHSTLWVSNDNPQDERAEPIRAGERMRQTSWPDLVTSFAILENVVRAMSLHVVPANAADSAVLSGFDIDERFRPGQYELQVDDSGWQYKLLDADGTQVHAGILGDSVGRVLGFRWKPSPAALGPGRVVKFTLLSPREAALALRRNVTIAFSPESNLLGLTLRGSDPQRTTATMTAMLDEFIATAAELKKRNVTEVAKALKQQLDHAERELRDAEIALERFRVQTITLPSEVSPSDGADAPRSPVFETFFTRQIEYENVRRDRQALEGTLSAIQEGTLEASTLWSVPVVDSSAPPDLRATLTELSTKQAALHDARKRYTDDHAAVRDLQRDVEELTQRIPLLGAGLVAELRRRENDLGSQIQGTARQLRAIPNRTTEETRLRRNVEADAALFATLKSRYDEATLAEASAVSDVSILDAPVAPQHPSRSRAPYVMLFGALAGIALAIALALLLDRLDRRFRYAEQATNELGLDVIGTIPSLEHVAGDRHGPEETSQLVEAFRSIRLNLMHAFSGTGQVVITVSSPGPGDGKSLICSHLALSFAEAGCRTVLVDGDLRRGALHTRFGLERRPGLLDYLAGDIDLDAVLRSSSYTNLTVMPRGALHHRAPELLMSPKMSKLITDLEERYDTIIVDSPPLGAGIDPFVLGTAAGSLLLVLRSGETDRRIAEAKLKLIARLPIRLLGVVLNDISDERSYPYYAYLPSDLPEDGKRPSEVESQVADFARRTVLAPAEKQ